MATFGKVTIYVVSLQQSSFWCICLLLQLLAKKAVNSPDLPERIGVGVTIEPLKDEKLVERCVLLVKEYEVLNSLSM